MLFKPMQQVWPKDRFQIPDFWPRSQYFLNFHYGYSARSEASESAKFWQFLKGVGYYVACPHRRVGRL